MSGDDDLLVCAGMTDYRASTFLEGLAGEQEDNDDYSSASFPPTPSPEFNSFKEAHKLMSCHFSWSIMVTGSHGVEATIDTIVNLKFSS